MAIIDAQGVLGEAQAVTDTAVPTTNVFDLGPVGRSGYASGDPEGLKVVFTCTEDFAEAGTTNTLTFSLRTSATAAGDVLSGTIKTLAASNAIVAKGTIKVGTKIDFQPNLPPNCLRYIDGYFTPVGTFTGGKITTVVQGLRSTS